MSRAKIFEGVFFSALLKRWDVWWEHKFSVNDGEKFQSKVLDKRSFEG